MICRYGEVTNETHKQMGALLQLYFASEEKKKKDYLLSQKQKEKLKPIYKLQKGSEKTRLIIKHKLIIFRLWLIVIFVLFLTVFMQFLPFVIQTQKQFN